MRNDLSGAPSDDHFGRTAGPRATICCCLQATARPEGRRVNADTGTINQLLHLWKFDDDADRRARWAAVPSEVPESHSPDRASPPRPLCRLGAYRFSIHRGLARVLFVNELSRRLCPGSYANIERLGQFERVSARWDGHEECRARPTDGRGLRHDLHSLSFAFLHGRQQGLAMCGRFTNRLTWEEIVRLYRPTIQAPPHNVPPRYKFLPHPIRWMW
jgi:hypothetical protein